MVKNKFTYLGKDFHWLQVKLIENLGHVYSTQ